MSIQDKDMETLAAASVDQLDAMVNGDDSSEITQGAKAEGVDDGEQTVEDGAAVGATEENDLADGHVEMKGGKGTIPYAVLKETREELAETRRKLEELQSRSYHAVIPEDYAEQVAGVQEELQGLGKQFEDGDIAWEEYQTRQEELTAKRESLLSAKIKAEISAEMQAQNQASPGLQAAESAEESWGVAVESFIGIKQDGIDYKSDPAMLGELDTVVKLLANDEANDDKDFSWFLEMAHSVVMTKHGVARGQGQGARADGQDAGDGEADKPSGPPFHTLSDIHGGLPPARSEIEQVAEVSSAALTNRFMNDPSQIDNVIASLG